MSSFRHAGDLGDIVYALPTIRALGGGTLYIEAATYTRSTLTPDRWCGADVLIKRQPYIKDVLPWSPRIATGFNLNDFRPKMMAGLQSRNIELMRRSLADWCLDTFQLDLAERDHQWIECPARSVAEVIINRTGPGRAPHNVYHNPAFPWRRVIDKYAGRIGFIGTPIEHAVFCSSFGDVPYVMTDNLDDAAQVIAGCRLFVGNQSCCYAIAEGMKKPAILEVWPAGPNCLFYRNHVIHGWTHDFPLPEL